LAAIVRDCIAVWDEAMRRWYTRSRERRTWRPEDVVSDCTDLFEHLTPLTERTINLTLNGLRPLARSVQRQRG
jgi:hypothetical protein